MSRRLLIISLAIFLLFPGSLVAQEKKETEKKPMCPMMEMMDKGGMMSKSWYMGAMSQMLSQMLADAGEILAGGATKPEGQKQLAAVIKKLGEMIPEVFSPVEVKKPEELQKQLKELRDNLEKIKAQNKSK